MFSRMLSFLICVVMVSIVIIVCIPAVIIVLVFGFHGNPYCDDITVEAQPPTMS